MKKRKKIVRRRRRGHARQRILGVLPARQWRHKFSGRTASIYGAVPWTGGLGNTEKDWEMVTVGWTWENANGTIGLGRIPAKTKDEAEKVMREVNAR